MSNTKQFREIDNLSSKRENPMKGGFSFIVGLLGIKSYTPSPFEEAANFAYQMRCPKADFAMDPSNLSTQGEYVTATSKTSYRLNFHIKETQISSIEDPSGTLAMGERDSSTNYVGTSWSTDDTRHGFSQLKSNALILDGHVTVGNHLIYNDQIGTPHY